MPAQAPTIPQPATLLSPAALLQRLPEAIDLSLGFAFDDNGEAVVERIEGTCLDGVKAATLTLPAGPLGVSAGMGAVQLIDEPGIRDV